MSTEDLSTTKDEFGREVYVGLDKASKPIDYLKMYHEGRLPKVTPDTLLCEMQLLALGNFFPLAMQVDLAKFYSEIGKYDSEWVPYLPRAARVNERQGLCLVGMPGDTYRDSLSMPEARYRHKRELFESDFSCPTELYKELTSLHSVLDYFSPLGRTFLVKCNEAGWFASHRDGKWIGRDTFRLVVFLKNSSGTDYEWMLDGKKLNIDHGRVYYINTRLEHHTFSMVNDSIHLIINVPMNLTNVLKLLTFT